MLKMKFIGATMRKVFLQIDVTLDGFIADASGETDWVTSNETMNSEASELLDTVDTILLGRVAYQDFVSFWPFADMSAPTTISKITSQINHADKIIFSKTLDKVQWGTFNNARLIHDNIPEEITKLKASSGKNLLLYAGQKIIFTFVQNNLIDEYHLRVHPVVLGSGLPLFPHIENRLKLNLLRTRPYDNGVVMSIYQPK
ncbi:MAG: dihydrofolate reductase [Anaerolineaceae bacterium]|nr:dihydrofolate reductase [Anaerolineaceae bacterium]